MAQTPSAMTAAVCTLPASMNEVRTPLARVTESTPAFAANMNQSLTSGGNSTTASGIAVASASFNSDDIVARPARQARTPKYRNGISVNASVVMCSHAAMTVAIT